MKILRHLAFACMILFPALSYAEESGLMRISLIQGDVQISGPDLTDWTAASINFLLDEGDRLWVPEGGRVETQIQGGVYIRADEKTAFDILSLGSDSAQLYLDRGHLYINNRRGGIKTVQVDTPLASVRSYDNSIMILDVDEGGAAEVSVLKGYVYAETRSGATRIDAGNVLALREDASGELAPIGPPDEWERWNLERDKQLVAWGESSRYLPAELHEYSSDFDDNGRWDYVGDYGYVWTPTVTIVEWAPYTVGRWIWIRGNYVWISFESWGWAPYHYGRWIFIAGYGWCWVPPAPGAVYWGPGFVGWTVTPTFVAWVPLAPGEIYYGYGSYGPASVNINTININTIAVNQTYRNCTVQNAVTVVRRDAFGTGARTPVKLRENPFLVRRWQRTEVIPLRVRPERRVVITQPEAGETERGRPPGQIRVRPEEPMARPNVPVSPPVARPETRVVNPFTYRVPQEKQPPESVKKTMPEELKTKRKFAKEPGTSVFRPGQPENMPVKRLREPRIIIRKPMPQPGQQQQKKNQGEKKNAP